MLREDVVWKAPPPEDASGSVPAPAAVASDAPLPVLNKTPLSPSVLTYVDTTFRQGKRYNYYLVAVDKTGNRSLRSSFGHLSSPDLIPPAPPKKLAVKTKNREGITLGWLPNREDDLFGYRVFKGANPNAMAPIGPNVVRAPKNTFTDTLIHANEIYFYKIIALDESENKSKPSEVIKVKAPDTLSPSMPAGLLAKSGDAKVYLRWAAVKDTDLKGYRVLNALAETGPFVPIGKDFGKQVTTHLHKPLKNGQKRWYVVQSVDYSGNLSEATDPALAMPADTKPPVAPAAPTFVVSQSVLTLMVVPNKEKDIAGYRLFRVVEIPTGVPEEVIPEQLFEPSRKEIRIETQKPDVPHWYFLVARDTSENESRDGMKAGPVLIKSQTTP